jgi:nucleotide-binding universal stress UspA family protein
MIAIKKILVPTDLSNESVPAIGYAISLAKDHGAEVIIFHTVPARMLKPSSAADLSGGIASEGVTPIAFARQPTVENLLESRKRLLRNFLEQKIASDLLRGIQIAPLVRLGKVVDEIVSAAKEVQADVIVMTSQASPLRRLFHVSFIERIMHKAPCPVLTILPSAEIRNDKDERVPIKSMEKWAA